MYRVGVGGMRGRNWDTRALSLAEMRECARGTFCPRFVHRCGKLGLSGGGGGGGGVGGGPAWGRECGGGCASEMGGGRRAAIGIEREDEGGWG